MSRSVIFQIRVYLQFCARRRIDFRTILRNHSLLKQLGTNLCHFSAAGTARSSVATPNKTKIREKEENVFRQSGFPSLMNVCNLACPFSSDVPASVCGRPVGHRGRAGEVHEADLHLLSETGGDQSQDPCGLVLHAHQRERRPSEPDSRRRRLSIAQVHQS